MLARQVHEFAGSPQQRSLMPQRAELIRQAGIARRLGSPFVEQVLEAAARQLDAAPALASRIDTWSGDIAADAVAMRLNAGLHALARCKFLPDLTRLYCDRRGDFDSIIGKALILGEAKLLEWLQWPTQTNEVARCSAFMAALAWATVNDPRPIELLELGASAGLNLNLTRYHHMLGGQSYGDRCSQLVLAPQWSGLPPPNADVNIAVTSGVDLRPIDITDPAAQERMMAFVWADQDERLARLRTAIAIAQPNRPHVEAASAPSWLADQLARSQEVGVRRVVVHSMVTQYLSDSDRKAIFNTIMRAGTRATPRSPFAWVSLEWTPDRREVQLRLIEWGACGEGKITHLATCHPYGDSITWLETPVYHRLATG